MISYEYCIDISNNNACDATWTTTGTTTSAELSGLSAGTTYYWQVRAIDGSGTTYADGSATAFWSFATVAPPGALGKIAPPDGATGQSTSPTPSWGTSSGAASYEFCIDTTNDNACVDGWNGTGTDTSTVLGGLAGSTTYFWQARAINGGGTTYADGSATAYWSFTTSVAPPGEFGKIAPPDGATAQSTSPTLSWGTSTGAAGYEYCIDTSSNNTCDATWTSTGTATSAVVAGLAAATTYSWQVRAINGGGTTDADEGATAYWSFTTSVAAPGAFGKIAPPDGATGQSTSPTLSWGTSTGVAANWGGPGAPPVHLRSAGWVSSPRKRPGYVARPGLAPP